MTRTDIYDAPLNAQQAEDIVDQLLAAYWNWENAQSKEDVANAETIYRHWRELVISKLQRA